MGKKMQVRVTIDRPQGYKDNHGNIYPLNYGYIPEIIAGDGEGQDVYIISKDVNEAIASFTGEIVAIIHRKDDVEDKWVATKVGEELSITEIKNSTHFLEQYFQSTIELL
ncbi:inorganic diphosphatase [Tetragenococcus solitarius]|uniref:inorganic diphosphatase n=1 Tax=Tetragenococcus solitarius TaxID=71453 RepID=A0ABN3YD08_9ENTE|nr:inorganic diphosphatase [Tetragenococcus solitarius]